MLLHPCTPWSSLKIVVVMFVLVLASIENKFHTNTFLTPVQGYAVEAALLKYSYNVKMGSAVTYSKTISILRWLPSFSWGVIYWEHYILINTYIWIKGGTWLPYFPVLTSFSHIMGSYISSSNGYMHLWLPTSQFNLLCNCYVLSS